MPWDHPEEQTPMKAWHAILTLSACTLFAPAVAAIECGASVAGHVTLTADLHCTSGWTALYVDTPGTVIELNGHTLSGTAELAAISVHAAHGVTVRGPGTVRGFWAGVNASRSDDLQVEGLLFVDLGTGVIASQSSRARVVGNRFELLRGHAVTIPSLPGIGVPHAGGHLIERNLVEHSTFGFELCGQRNGDSRVAGNTLLYIASHGIVLADGIAATTVADNTLAEVGGTGILLRAASHNLVQGNHAKRGWVGIGLEPQGLGFCDAGTARAEASHNDILGNGVFEHEIAVSVGGIGTAAAAERNRIRDNRLHYGSRGIRLLADSARNDARRNSYLGTVTPVEDFGTANRW
jgi:nitrous oxidase accessory protein NosD